MNGIGHLVIRSGEHTVLQYALQEGGGVTSSLNGHEFQFVLDRAPLPSGFDIRQMDSAQIAKALVNRLEDEAAARENEWTE